MTPSPTSAAPSQRSTVFGEVSAGALGLNAATADRLGAAVDVGEAAAPVVALAVAVGVIVRVGVGAAVAVGTAVAVGAALAIEVAVGTGAGVVPEPSDAQALVSAVSTIAQTERPPCAHTVPSVAVRESDRRMKG
jgi:hypothetical protein